jgi:hypothetical protein
LVPAVIKKSDQESWGEIGEGVVNDGGLGEGEFEGIILPFL